MIYSTHPWRSTCPIPFEGVKGDGVIFATVTIWYDYLSLLLDLCNRHPHVIISPIETNRWILRENFLKELLSELPKCNGLYDISWFIQPTLSAFWIHAIYHYNSQRFHTSHQRVIVLASAVSYLFVLYEVTNTFNIEVHVEVHLSWLIHIDHPFAFVLSKSSLICLLKNITLG